MLYCTNKKQLKQLIHLNKNSNKLNFTENHYFIQLPEAKINNILLQN